ncbi:RES domain-containing protein [Rudanella paleaurantiibacter]|uniref:RES domain-containing protein n=1 Tax=Rudanella paleaurantiibacter TaxID=2614655 RepID=A0A7J5TZJ8_9BACT|nr:RES family NAD+ phosphorylase [Rudanella paleaurantiibacter]KAB7729326.1 RES domain-containing protein [Rudanella paleaurantiibacter]
MDVYRIAKARYADTLMASGAPARWNLRGQFVLYTASSRSLACLENIVHRSAEGLLDDFRTMVIYVPDAISVEQIALEQLPSDWFLPEQYSLCQALGSAWIRSMRSAVLRVPSAIIPQEWNYLLNPAHPDFSTIQLTSTEPFWFDGRLKE